MTTTEAAVMLGCTSAHIRRLINDGKLPARLIRTKIGRYWDIAKKDLDAYAAIEQTVGWPRGKPRIEVID